MKKKCRHKWIRKFVEGKNWLDDLCVWEVWYCKKCKIETKGEFKGIIEMSKQHLECNKRISPEEVRKL